VRNGIIKNYFHMFKAYQRLIVSNAAQVSSIESSLRTLTYILPGRFQDSEVASEALFSGLNLLGIYHDHVLDKAAEMGLIASTQETKAETSQLHNRYLQGFYSSSRTFSYLSVMLTILRYTEVLMEMVVKKKAGNEARWNLVTFLEAFKHVSVYTLMRCRAMARMVLVHVTERRMLVAPPHNERVLDPTRIVSHEQDVHMDQLHYSGLRTGKRIAKLASVTRTRPESSGGMFGAMNAEANDNVTKFLHERLLKPEQVVPPKELMRPLTGLSMLSEYLHILRPLVYVLLIRKLGERTWKPWIAALLMDLASRYWAMQATHPLEKQAQKRRKRLLFYYILRQPFYCEYTKHVVCSVVMCVGASWKDSAVVWTRFPSCLSLQWSFVRTCPCGNRSTFTVWPLLVQ
jgi:peroxin-16